jgi:phosphatidate cytidylyltransferase
VSNLALRILTAIVAIPVAAGLIYLGDLPFALFLGVLAGAGTWELFRIARHAGMDPLDPIGIVAAASLPLAAHASRTEWLERPIAGVGVIFVTIIGTVLFARRVDERPLESVAMTVFAPLYTGGTLSFAYALRHHPWTVGAAAGSALVFYPIAMTWATDIGAYAFGRLFGSRKLMPAVSPGKTIAGAWGGLALGVAAALAYNAWVLKPLAHLALLPSIAAIVGLALAAAVQVGDLAESLFKRQGNVKDSSNLVPGHGGVLDRLDSLYFSLPVAYLLLSRLLIAVPA